MRAESAGRTRGRSSTRQRGRWWDLVSGIEKYPGGRDVQHLPADKVSYHVV